MTDITFREWELLARQDAATSLAFDLMYWKFKRPSYDEWADKIEGAVRYQCSQMVRGKHHLAGSTEDVLTWTIITSMKNLGLDASMEVVGGNCDVAISFQGEYLWIGEAKIWRGPAYVWGGYLQLTTRYATGLPSHSRGGMLIYCLDHSAVDAMAEWRAALGVELNPVEFADDKELPPSFWSTERNAGTGVMHRVHHLAFPLHSDPKDANATLSGGAKAAIEAVRAPRRQRQGGRQVG